MTFALVATIFSEFLGISILLVVIYFLWRPISHGAIYFPTSPRGVRNMLKLADPQPGQKIVDLGSGDGRILMAIAERGVQAVGYEINPIIARRSRDRIKKAGLADRASVYWESFWRIDLGQFDTVIVYGIPYIMRDLQKKLERELKPGTKIISNAYVFPGWTPVATEGKVMLYLMQ